MSHLQNATTEALISAWTRIDKHVVRNEKEDADLESQFRKPLDSQTDAILIAIKDLDFEGQIPRPLEIPTHAVGGGVLWWNANMLSMVVQPSVRLSELVRQAKNSLSWQPPLIGVHIRFEVPVFIRHFCIMLWVVHARQMLSQLIEQADVPS